MASSLFALLPDDAALAQGVVVLFVDNAALAQGVVVLFADDAALAQDVVVPLPDDAALAGGVVVLALAQDAVLVCPGMVALHVVAIAGLPVLPSSFSMSRQNWCSQGPRPSLVPMCGLSLVFIPETCARCMSVGWLLHSLPCRSLAQMSGGSLPLLVDQ